MRRVRVLNNCIEMLMASSSLYNMHSLLRYVRKATKIALKVQVTVQPVIFPDIHGNGTVKSRLIQVELAAEFVAKITEHIRSVQPKIWIANAANPINILAVSYSCRPLLCINPFEKLKNIQRIGSALPVFSGHFVNRR